MRIAYGVMGYGRGHAMRTAAVLPELLRDHDVRVYAGIDAYRALSDRFDCERIPVIGYQYGADGRLSGSLTLRRNFRLTTDLLTGGPTTRDLWRRIDRFAPDLVISDSETWTHRYARARGIPRIGFDHVGIMAFCHCRFAPEDWWRGRRDALGYRAFMGRPDRVLVSSFYPAPPRAEGTAVVGPILRESVLAATPRQGDYLVAYLNKGGYQYTGAMDRALRGCGERIIVYGTDRRGRDGALEFKAPANEGFVADLAGAKGVIATAGNQLLGEAIYLGKPILAMPEDVVEQRLNARAVVDLGVGIKTDLGHPRSKDIAHFLRDLDRFAAATRQHRRDGREEAKAALTRYLTELKPDQGTRRSTWATRIS